MIKYSFALLATAIIAFNTGCDSDCCGSNVPEQTQTPQTATNTAPVILNLLGVANNSTKTCTPGEVLDLTANATDQNQNLDENTYVWKVDGTVVTNGTIDCPADGQTKKVCATVKDEEGLESSEVCITLDGKAEPATCPPLEITAVDKADTTYVVNGVEDSATPNDKALIGGHVYDFYHTKESCPTVCTWKTLQSTRVEGNFSDTNILNCIENGEVIDSAGHIVLENNDTTRPSVEVHTCDAIDDNNNSKYKEIKVEVSCDDGTSAVRYFDITLP
jgi:hypothetical protein